MSVLKIKGDKHLTQCLAWCGYYCCNNHEHLAIRPRILKI